MTTTPLLKLNIDYYLNSEGNVVFTKKYLLDRGHCCQSGCLHCPYSFNEKIDSSVPAELQSNWGHDFSEEE